jgi:hypothetical protein
MIKTLIYLKKKCQRSKRIRVNATKLKHAPWRLIKKLSKIMESD